MTTGQSQEPEGIKSVSENGEEKNVSSPLSKKDLSEQEFSSKQNEKLENDESLSPSIPAEVLDKLPPKEKNILASSLSIMAMMGSSPRGSSIGKQLKSEHLTQIIENSEKDSQRDFEKIKINENTKRWGMGAILALVVVVLTYAGITKDKDLSEKVILASISAIGGAAGGYGIGYAAGKNK